MLNLVDLFVLILRPFPFDPKDLLVLKSTVFRRLVYRDENRIRSEDEYELNRTRSSVKHTLRISKMVVVVDGR